MMVPVAFNPDRNNELALSAGGSHHLFINPADWDILPHLGHHGYGFNLGFRHLEMKSDLLLHLAQMIPRELIHTSQTPKSLKTEANKNTTGMSIY